MWGPRKLHPDDFLAISRSSPHWRTVARTVNVQLLIDSIVRQTTVLIAQLATRGGIRAPLAHVANQVFVDLATELNNQGVSRKVSADMFGMALRAYVRKVQRLGESSTERGRTLWEAVVARAPRRRRTARNALPLAVRRRVRPGRPSRWVA